MYRKVDYSHNGIFCLVNKLIFVRNICSFKVKFIQHRQQIKFVDTKSNSATDVRRKRIRYRRPRQSHPLPSHGKPEGREGKKLQQNENVLDVRDEVQMLVDSTSTYIS